MRGGELLLHWLSHVGRGSWATFRRAFSAVIPEEESTPITAGTMRARLSELTHVEFFVGGGNQWRVFEPVLGGLPGAHGAILAGGRTPRLVDALAGSCRDSCTLEVLKSTEGPDSIRVSGAVDALAEIARAAGISYLPDLASALCAELEPIEAVLSVAVPGAAPLNWSVRSFDLGKMRWVEELLPDTAYEYASRHGGLRHYVRGPGHALLQLDRRQSVYAAAYMNRVALVSYNGQERSLSVPRGAPLPDPAARAAAACRGTPAVAREDRLVYLGVPAAIAAVVMAACGQRPPEPHWLSNGSGRG